MWGPMLLERSRDSGSDATPADTRTEALRSAAAVLDAVTPEARPIVLPGQRVRDKLAAGVPLLHGEEVYVDGGVVVEIWDRILAALADVGTRAADVTAVRAALAGHRLNAEHATVEALVSHPEHVREIAAAADALADLVLTVADLAARPVLAAYARQLAPALRLAAWERGYCPICGAWPVRGERVSKGATLRLRCGRCTTGWEPERHTCQECGTVEALGSPEVHDARQAPVTELGCGACGHHLRVVEPAANTPTPGALLAWRDMAPAIEEPGHVLAPGRPSGAGFRLELSDGEAEWDGFDDD